MKYDLITIGGGPSGMIASGRAGQLNKKVLLIEKNKELGLKLLITGKNRCNVTHYSEKANDLIGAYGTSGKFLYSSFSRFSNFDIVRFFEERGLKMKVERGDRVFPASDKSVDVRKVLLGFLQENNVEILKGVSVKKIVKNEKGKTINKIILSNGTELKAKKYIISTGGLSYPSTGSTGDGYAWAESLGHKIISPHPALSPIVLKNKFVKRIEGLSLKNIKITAFKKTNNSVKDIVSEFGEAVFTRKGISGPIILNISKKVGEALQDIDEKGNGSEIILKIDFKPSLCFEKLDKRIQRDFRKGNNKQFKNILNKLLPGKIIPIIIELSKINPDKKVNLITKQERQRLLFLLKEFQLNVSGLVGFNKAIITAGGIDLKEIDSKTMRSKIIKNLFFAGEVLNLDGPTGGYNLQVCWTTGWIAGELASDF